jgi:HSP20 family protein
MNLTRKTDHFLVPTFNGLMDDFFGREFFGSNTKNGFLPATNIYEDEKNFRIELVAPGRDKSDFKIGMQDRVLTISSEKEEKNIKKEGEGYTLKEFSFFSFKRSFKLPETIDLEHIKGAYENGVLNVVLPKKAVESKQEKLIEIA